MPGLCLKAKAVRNAAKSRRKSRSFPSAPIRPKAKQANPPAKIKHPVHQKARDKSKIKPNVSHFPQLFAFKPQLISPKATALEKDRIQGHG